MNESGYSPQFYKKLGYNKSRDIVSQRRREWEGFVFPHLELKKPYNHKNFYDMIYTFDAYSTFPEYPKSRQEIVIPVWTPPVMIPVDLMAAPSSSGGISGVWSDAFTGTEGEAVNPTKWTFGFGVAAQISSNQCYMWGSASSLPGYGDINLAYIISKAPTWDNFSATVYAPFGTGNNGGVAIGWWPNIVMWGMVYGFTGPWQLLFTPTGLITGPEISNSTPFTLKIVKTPTTASGYYKLDDGEWILITTIVTPPTTALHVAGAGAPSRDLYIVDTFNIDFSNAGTPYIDLQWIADAPSFDLKRNGATIYSGPLKAYTDTGVVTVTTYLYEITAYDVKGNRIGYDAVYATTL